MKDTKKEETQNKSQQAGKKLTPGFYYPEVVAYIKRKRQIAPRICEVELAKSLNQNKIAKYISKSEVREILHGLR